MHSPGSPGVRGATPRLVRRAAWIAAALPLAAATAGAQSPFTDRAAFLAAVASPLTFNASAYCPAAPPGCAQPVRLFEVGPLQVTSGAWWVARVMSVPAFGFQPNAPQGNAAFVVFRSPTPLTAFGIDFAAPVFAAPSSQTVFSFTFDAGPTFSTGQQPSGGPERPSFFGFVSPTPFTEVRLSVLNVTEGTSVAASGAMYNQLTLGTIAPVAVVPEPGTLALVGGGLVVLVAGVRRRRR